MNNFQVELTKSYLIKIKAKNKQQAKELAEFYTGDITDLSTSKEKENFEIEKIECVMNEGFGVREVK